MQEVHPDDIEVSPSLTLVELEPETEKRETRRSARLRRNDEDRYANFPSMHMTPPELFMTALVLRRW